MPRLFCDVLMLLFWWGIAHAVLRRDVCGVRNVGGPWAHTGKCHHLIKLCLFIPSNSSNQWRYISFSVVLLLLKFKVVLPLNFFRFNFFFFQNQRGWQLGFEYTFFEPENIPNPKNSKNLPKNSLGSKSQKSVFLQMRSLCDSCSPFKIGFSFKFSCLVLAINFWFGSLADLVFLSFPVPNIQSRVLHSRLLPPGFGKPMCPRQHWSYCFISVCQQAAASPPQSRLTSAHQFIC